MEDGSCTSWNTWASDTPTIMDHYISVRILNRVKETYDEIRHGAFEKPEHYTKEFLHLTNVRYVNSLKLIKKKFGWPTEEKFGQECALGASLIAQHAVHDPEFQQECLQELAQLTSRSELQYYAYLLDLIQVQKGKPQHFGTQMDPQGKLYPIQGYTPNPANLAETELQLEVVNNRRESVGFLSLQDAQAKLSQFIMHQQPITEAHVPQPTESAQ